MEKETWRWLLPYPCLTSTRARRPGWPWGTRIGMTRFGGSGRSDMGTGRSCCAHAPMFKLLSSVLSGSTAGAGRRNTTAFWRVAHPVQHPADAGEQRVVRHWQGRRRHRVLPGVVPEVVALQHRAQLHTAKYSRAGPVLRALRARSPRPLLLLFPEIGGKSGFSDCSFVREGKVLREGHPPTSLCQAL